MVGIFGNHPEDRRMEQELDEYLAKEEMAEMREEQIESRAKDLVSEKLLQLPLTYGVSYERHGKTFDYKYSYLQEAFQEMDAEEFKVLGTLLSEHPVDYTGIGLELERIVRKQLNKDALYEAEIEVDADSKFD